MPDESRQQRRSRLNNERMIRGINMLADNAERLRNRRDEAKNDLDELLERHRQFKEATVQEKTIFWIMNSAQLFVYVLDFLVCSAVAEYISRMANLSEREIMLARAFIPLMIIGIEITIDSFRQYPNIRATGGYRLCRVIFAILAGLMTLAMPGIFVGTQLAARYSDPNPLPLLFFLLIVVPLAILTMAGHTLMILGEMAALEARSYLYFITIRRRPRRRFRRSESAVRRAEQRLIDDFQLYCQLVEQHNAQFESKLEHGPFTDSARKIINELFGYDVIQTPDGSGNNGGGGGDDGGGSASIETGQRDNSAEDNDPIFSPTDSDWNPF